MHRLRGVKECLYPASAEEAARMLIEKGNSARIVGGGLHLSAFPSPQVSTLIFLTKAGLNYIKIDDERVHVGALATITDFAENREAQGVLRGSVSRTCKCIASQLLRNQITFGGSVAQREPYSDIASILLALKAKVLLNDGSDDFEIEIEEFYKKDFRSILKKAVIKELNFENFGSDFHFSMERFTRNATDISHLNVAALLKLEELKILNASIFVGSRPSSPYRFTEIEEFLKGKELGARTAEEAQEFAREKVEVEKDIRISKEYRKELVGVYVKRILLKTLSEVV